jgi:hypothetical protein
VPDGAAPSGENQTEESASIRGLAPCLGVPTIPVGALRWCRLLLPQASAASRGVRRGRRPMPTPSIRGQGPTICHVASCSRPPYPPVRRSRDCSASPCPGCIESSPAGAPLPTLALFALAQPARASYDPPAAASRYGFWQIGSPASSRGGRPRRRRLARGRVARDLRWQVIPLSLQPNAYADDARQKERCHR